MSEAIDLSLPEMMLAEDTHLTHLNSLLRDRSILASTFAEDIRVVPTALLKQAAASEVVFGLKPRWKPSGECIVVEQTLVKSLERICEVRTAELARVTESAGESVKKRLDLRINNPTVHIPHDPTLEKEINPLNLNASLEVPSKDGIHQRPWSDALASMNEFNHTLGARYAARPAASLPIPVVGLGESIAQVEGLWDRLGARMDAVEGVAGVRGA
ncbi:hypothetical protein HDU67_007045 [Dinochytrium kinnereticum]|nr:hypothetical protein HDU67_007045 [Dinochytrium kinnereticum]